MVRNNLNPNVKTITADQILDKYLGAIGGAAEAAKLTSFVAKGTYAGFETLDEKVPMEIYVQAPNQLTTVIHTRTGDSVSTFDGTNGWIANADKLMRVLPLAGGDLEGAKMDALLAIPARIKTDYQWRAGFPATSIDNKPVQVIQNGNRAESGVKLYFDSQTGLLVRQVRYVETAVGVIPARVDYSDYRPVAGVKIPFHRVVTWTDGRSTIELSDIQPNVRIEARRFAMPAPPVAKQAAK
jgi:hypothetical protein